MSLTTPYQEHYYIADGQTARFSFGEYFSAPASDNVKCIIYFENGTTSVPTFTVNTTAGYIDIVSLTPPAGSTVRVFRDTPEQQNVTASQLQNYTAKQLEKIFDSIVAMIQENGYTTEHKTLRLTETQRDVLLGFLKESNEGALLYWDNANKTITPTDFPKEDVVRCVNGLFFRISTTQAGIPYLEWSVNGLSDWHSSSATWGAIGGNINDQTDLKNALDAKQNTISDLSTIRSGAAKGATAVQPNDNITVLNNNAGYITASYHDATKQDLLVDGTNIKTVNGNSLLGSGNITISSSVAWGNIQGTLIDQTDLKNALDAKADNNAVVHLTGTETITGNKTFSGTNVFTGTTNVPTPSNPNESSTRAANTQWVHDFAYSYVSNCIAEIPQDIKLELNNGTLTLKAGSKVYVPNGSGVFDTHTVAADLQSLTSAVSDGSVFVFWTNIGLQLRNISNVSSGPTEPTITLFSGWYDTTNNLVKLDASGSVWQTATVSFPIAVITVSSGVISSIDRVFNGFGYIGSRVFCLPGVKCLLPDGRKADGSLKNTSLTTSSVSTGGIAYSSSELVVVLAGNGNIAVAPGLAYDEETNRVYSSGGALARCIVGSATTTTGGVITSFDTKTVFHAVDYNDYAQTQSQVSTNTNNISTLGTSKANTSLDNVSAGIDFVVESQEPTAGNNYTWYRKYKSGWVEQGGNNVSVTSDTTIPITLPIVMKDSHYNVDIAVEHSLLSSTSSGEITYSDRTTTGFNLNYGKDTAMAASWIVFGMTV